MIEVQFTHTATNYLSFSLQNVNARGPHEKRQIRFIHSHIDE